MRAAVIRSIRNFFSELGYLELETPSRIPAPAPEAHIDSFECEGWYLHPSPELCMKQMLAAGYPKIFQICKAFRKNERGGKHLPELTLLEWYAEGETYEDLMVRCEGLFHFIAGQNGFGEQILWQGHTIDLAPPWERLSVSDAFDRYSEVSMEEALAGDTFDEIMGLEIEPRLGLAKPLFLYDYPAQKGALARLKPSDQRYAERFELYIAGLELCNAFTELNNPEEQRDRFIEEIAYRNSLGKSAYPMPEKFLDALHHMPDAAGIALGVDRLVMLFADTNDIAGVVAFTPEDL